MLAIRWFESAGRAAGTGVASRGALRAGAASTAAVGTAAVDSWVLRDARASGAARSASSARFLVGVHLLLDAELLSLEPEFSTDESLVVGD